MICDVGFRWGEGAQWFAGVGIARVSAKIPSLGKTRKWLICGK